MIKWSVHLPCRNMEALKQSQGLPWTDCDQFSQVPVHTFRTCCPGRRLPVLALTALWLVPSDMWLCLQMYGVYCLPCGQCLQTYGACCLLCGQCLQTYGRYCLPCGQYLQTYGAYYLLYGWCVQRCGGYRWACGRYMQHGHNMRRADTIILAAL